MPINPIRLSSQMIIPCVTPDEPKKSRVKLGNKFYTFSGLRYDQFSEGFRKFHRMFCYVHHEFTQDWKRPVKCFGGAWVALGISNYAVVIHPLLSMFIIIGYWSYLFSLVKDPGEEFLDEFYSWMPTENKILFDEIVRKNQDIREYFERNPEIKKEIEENDELMGVLHYEPKLIRIFMSRPHLYDHIKTHYSSIHSEILRRKFPELRKWDIKIPTPSEIDIEEID